MEANNNKALREALMAIKEVNDTRPHDAKGYEINDIITEALREPPRQCDVGTPDEQSERFENFCLKYIGCAEETGGRHCVGCPLEKASKNITQKCELYWAQMPYEESEVRK